MGYSTAYSLTVHRKNDLTSKESDPENLIGEIWETIPQEIKENGLDYALNRNGCTEEPCKWYEHSEDMKKLSKLHPTKVFILTGYGEERGDVWRNCYVNGKEQSVKGTVVFPPFKTI